MSEYITQISDMNDSKVTRDRREHLRILSSNYLHYTQSNTMYLMVIMQDINSTISISTLYVNVLTTPLTEIFRKDKNLTQGFPGGAVVENLSANAGDTGFEPWSGKIPHAAEQLGP